MGLVKAQLRGRWRGPTRVYHPVGRTRGGPQGSWASAQTPAPRKCLFYFRQEEGRGGKMEERGEGSQGQEGGREAGRRDRHTHRHRSGGQAGGNQRGRGGG